MPSCFASALALVLNRMETIVFPAKRERQDCHWGWGLATLCPHITPHHCSHWLSRQPALQPRTHHPFPLHLMASLYTYRPQTFGLVFVIASEPSGKMKYTSPKYPHKAEVQNMTRCDSMVGTKGRGWCCSQAARGISQALHPSRSGHWRKTQSETASGSQRLSSPLR